MSDLLPLLVSVPVAGAVLPPVVGTYRDRSGWQIAALTLLVQATLVVALLSRVTAGGRIAYPLGGIPTPFGIELVFDGITAGVVFLIAGVSFGLLAYTRVGGPRSNTVYSLYLLLVAGLTGVCIAGDVFTLYVFLEIGGLAAYALVARGSSGGAALAALRYLFLGTIGATFYLLGVGYLYVATGTLNMADLAAHIPPSSPLAVAAFGFLFVGLAVKVALFPLHTWKPDAYQHSPAAVAALLSSLVSTTAAYAVLRVLYAVFTVEFLRANPLVDDVILLFGAASVLAGGVLAYRQTDLRRLLAYSSVTHFGLVVVGVGLANANGLTGAVIHLLGHAVMKGGFFVAVGVVAVRTGTTAVEGYTDLGDRLPGASGAIAVLALGMIGVPPTVGFVGKWYILLGAVEAGSWLAVAVVLASTLLSLTYFADLLQRMYVTPGAARSVTTDGPGGRVSPGMRATVLATAVLTAVLGVASVGIASLIAPTVTALLS